MKGDFTRFSFDPKKHYSGVFKQQGRVDLDADWNEYVETQRHIDLVRTRDIIGPCGVPINGKGDEESGGFKVTADEGNDDLQISPGNIYVDGILCQLQDSTTYLGQKDYPGRPELGQIGTDLVYLDVWMRHITAIEDPEIRETALGGPDTTTRIKTVWQVKVAKVDEDVLECADVKPWGQLSPTMPSQGLLSTSPSPAEDTVNPCTLIAEVGYSGLENRLYRVEIHDGGDTHALLNPVSPGKHNVKTINGANELTVNTEGLETEGPAWELGQVVEVSSAKADGQFKSILSRIVKVDDASHVLTVDTDLSDMVGNNNFNIKKVATFKWSRDNGSVVFPIEEFGEDDRKIITLKRLGRDQVLTLHNGDWVEVLDDASELSGRPGTMAQIVGEPNQARFTISLSQEIPPTSYQVKDHAKVRRWDQKSGAIAVNTDNPIYLEDGIKIQFSGSNFRTGDYWVFAARTTGEVETLVNAPPRGIEHHYCKLALIKWTPNEDGFITADVTDCRKKFKPLTELGSNGSGCCTVTVGDGTISKGDFNSIQDAIDSVRQKGAGRVCILPGRHKLNKTIEISEFPPKNEFEEVRSHPYKAVLNITGCGPQTQIFGPHNQDPAFHLDKSAFIQFESLTMEVEPTQSAIILDHCDLIKISNCIINIAEIDHSEEIGDISPLMISNSSNIIIEDNFFICPSVYKYAAIAIKGNLILFSGNKLSGVGIWVQDGSQVIFIQENLISGTSAGIILGGKIGAQEYGQVVGITITDNFIFGMDNSGICTMMNAIHSDVVPITGLGASPGVATGIVKIIADGIELDKVKMGDIIVTKMTMPDMVPGMKRAAAIVTDEGDMACHAAVVSRELGCPAVVGTKKATSTLKDGMKVTVDGNKGMIYGDQVAIGEAPKSSIDDLIIHRNRIMRCAQKGIDGRFHNRAVGGIVLLNASNVRIAENYIAENGNLHSSPACGIFVSMCHCLEVIDNNIINNGASYKYNSSDEIYQAGIIAMGVTGGNLPARSWVQPANADGSQPDFEAGVPAAIIADNVVVSPSGHALILTGIGQMSISNNSLTSQGQWHQPIKPLDRDLNCCVYILNYACSQVLRGDFASLLAEIGSKFELKNMDSVYEGIGDHPSGWMSNFPYGQVLFDGNQVTFQMTIEENAPLKSVDQDLIAFKGLLYNLADKFDSRKLISNLIASSVFLASGDDISIQDNQITSNLKGRILLADVAALAPTIRTSGNRFSESLLAAPEEGQLVEGAIYSCFSVGVMNLATDNQANNCIFVLGTLKSESKNQVVQNLCEDIVPSSPDFYPPSNFSESYDPTEHK